ncbi:MAG: hypothetical protein KBC74_02605 [Candidatus Pacebacteria bacterium]|nr:hypothetical protein [Candidatus Paceibacterota bacterium]MBP9832388.1 hypothetical protein [Candidatus Paceibacterota bacterium]
MTDITVGEGFRFERPQVARTVRRTNPERNLHTGDIPTLTHLPSTLGSKAPEAQNVSLVPYLGDIIGANAELLRDGFDGIVTHKEVIAFDVAAWLSLTWAGKLWRMVTRPRDRY